MTQSLPVDSTPAIDLATFPVVQPRRGLGLLGRKLALGQPVTLAYLGGSITSEPGYRPRTTAFLRDRFPRCDIREIDAGIGGTDSKLGAHRLFEDVLVGEPDLVFVEFAVNDGEADIDRAQACMEGIVRRCLRAKPQPELCFIYTLAERHMEAWRAGHLPVMTHAHEVVAAHYRLPSIHVGGAAARDLIAGVCTWDHLFRDSCHPAQGGREHYARTLAAALPGLLAQPLEEAVPRPIPPTLTPRPLENAGLMQVMPDTPRGDFRYEPRVKRGGWEPFSGLLLSDRPGDEVAFDFHGRSAGIMFMLGKDGGDVEVSIDGGPFEHHHYFDEYALTCYRPVPRFFANDLEPGPHQLRVRVSQERDQRSTGHRVEIGALLHA